MVQHIILQYNFNLVYANKLVDDLSEEQMTVTPYKGFENHPAFTLGHNNYFYFVLCNHL